MKKKPQQTPDHAGVDYLRVFYQDAVLPQFGVDMGQIAWGHIETTGPDEFYYRFWIEECEYILMFEDYEGWGRSASYIESELGLRVGEYEFVPPVSATGVAPSYDGFRRMPAPYQYIEGITGTFTLLRVYSDDEKASSEPKKIHRSHTGGVVEVDKKPVL